MNCKQGDLAYIVTPNNWASKILEGKFVDVGVSGICENGTFNDGTAWLCKFHTPWFCSFTGRTIRQCYIKDDWLRPLRDNPGQDETLTWAPVPSKVAA